MEGLQDQFIESDYLFWYAIVTAGVWWGMSKGKSKLKLNWGIQWFLLFIIIPYILLGSFDWLSRIFNKI